MDDMSTPTLAEIRAAIDAATPGKWEWKGKLSPDWMPDALNAFDDLRVEIPTPDKVYDADLYYVLQAMKSGFVMLRNADAELIANAPDYIRALLPVVEAAAEYVRSAKEDLSDDRRVAARRLEIALDKLKG